MYEIEYTIEIFDNYNRYSFITFLLPIAIYQQNDKETFVNRYFMLIKLLHLLLLMLYYSLIDFDDGQPLIQFLIVSLLILAKNHHHEGEPKVTQNNLTMIEETCNLKTQTEYDKITDATNGIVGVIKLNEQFEIIYQNKKSSYLMEDKSINEILMQAPTLIDKQTKQLLQEQCNIKLQSVQDFRESLTQISLKELLEIIKTNLPLPHQLDVYVLQDFEMFYFQILINKESCDKTTYNIVFQDMSDYSHYIKKKHSQTTMKQLFKSFSHELNTSLNYILALAQVAQCHENVPKTVSEKYFLPILHCGRIMHSLISDIMDYNLILSKQFNVEVSNFNIPQLISEVVDLFKYQVNQKHLKIQFQNNLLNYDLVSDRNRIRQILINLVSNAQKFTFSGQIRIQVGAVVNNKQLCVIFHVFDTGIGMKQDEVERLHQLLSSGIPQSARISQNTAGFGLGLYISNKIAEVLSQTRYEKGGGLRFESKYQSGFHAWFMARNQSYSPVYQQSNPTPIVRIRKKIQIDTMESQISRVNALPMRQKFSQILGIKDFKSERGLNKELSLKLRQPPSKIARELFLAAISSERRIESLSINQETNDQEFQNRIKHLNENCTNNQKCNCPQILIVDDEQINIMALSMMLDQMGYSSDSVFNGEECVNLIFSNQKKSKCNKCRSQQYRMIFMDINMPILDGIQATVRIKSKYSNIIVIACTAFSDTETRNICYKSGMSYHIQKPVKKDQLIEILSYYLN
ncbi:unnamed protein product (macronuclear) [Paramecium tetraurelia]|uniref:Histidine kinase n=1 Tax=Paramecium tetraurelia TaxID=5888 RepID=A0BZ66_PARTE|nr:uncharacterized protein GSPATT00033686001 [Paramecium tetraurelia]CAK63833.1 unnamed protein product [Paramecium tetraurelia]|eukprot:XP_001431231.1 hypothetical protein (macronuclear) [Paramecium tetraurelia strain d4-2]